MIKKFNLIILAGGKEEDWCRQYSYKRRAFLPLLEKPMLEWVITAFRRSEYIDKIVVVGPKELNQLDSMRYVHKHIFGGSSFIKNLLSAVFYVKFSIYGLKTKHNGYLISFCDAAFLTPGVIDATLENIAKHDPGLALHYVQKETIIKGGFPIENRSFMPVAGKFYTGSNIYYIKSLSRLLRIIKDVALVRKLRKAPIEILRYLGCENEDRLGIERALCKKIGAKVKIFISPFAEMGVDIDKPADYELARIHLLKLRGEYLKRRDKAQSLIDELNDFDADF